MCYIPQRLTLAQQSINFFNKELLLGTTDPPLSRIGCHFYSSNLFARVYKNL
jgi:hypothetical protein